MKTKQEIQNWIHKNCVDSEGDIDLSNLDFSDFDGNIYINNLKVKNDLSMNHKQVKGFFGNRK